MAFPDGFLWGGAAAASQRGGAYDADGKGSFRRIKKDPFAWYPQVCRTNGACLE
ncbi:MAG: family 1 glycosylhydrolase [Atopobiaceae bacterium]|nr:family 1 glycosylhydrolase [Atopobiaceae bacterium]